MARASTALLAIFSLVVLATPARADGWDDFSNNLATDLAPLLALFGEQVTKQFLSENITHLDYFIFAMAPMGIITAMVSAIRVCGSSSLRAFIGRAQEGASIAEAELCSSTSRDVSELFNDGGIARVFGRPKILEFVFVRPKEPQQSEGQDTDTFAPGHIYTFYEYMRTNDFIDDWLEKHWIDSTRLGTSAPNLSLNIGIKRKHIAIYFAVAILGLLLQAGVLAFAGVVTYRLRWLKNDLHIESYAFPLTAVGTVILAMGQYACAAVIGRCTEEGIWRKTKSAQEGRSQAAVTFHWLQPGPQTIGDQVFDSFSINDDKYPLLEYVKSIRQQNYKGALMVWFAVVTTLVGFVLQFVGLRVMHSSVAVAQLAAIVIMSAARSALRMQRLKKEDNELADCRDFVTGHELDWLALNLETPHICRALRLNLDHHRHDNFRFTPLFYFGGTRSQYSAHNSGAPTPSAFTKEDPNSFDNQITSNIMAYRSKLAELTTPSQGIIGSDSRHARQAHLFNTDMVTVRLYAKKLLRALDKIVDIMCTKREYLGNGTPASEVFLSKKFHWSIACFVGAHDRSSKFSTKTWRSESETVSLLLGPATGHRDTLRIERIEALLGLWVWSLKARQMGSSIETEQKRVVLSGTVTRSQLQLWLGRDQDIQRAVLRSKLESEPSSFTLWRKWTSGGPTVDESPIYTEFKGIDELDPQPATIHWGWFALPGADDVDSESLDLEIAAYTVDTNASYVTLCTQEIFGYFVKDVMHVVESVGDFNLREGEGELQLNNELVNDLVKAFMEADLGTREEAMLCVLPNLVPRFQSLETLAVTAATREADVLRKKGEWAKAANVLWWAFDACNSRFEKNVGEVPPQRVEEVALIKATTAIGELYRRSFMLGNTVNGKPPLGDSVFDEMLRRNPRLPEAEHVAIWYSRIGQRLVSHSDLVTELMGFAASGGLPLVICAILESSQGGQESVDFWNGMPLFQAIQQGNFDIAKHMLDRGADPDARDSDGRSLLWVAAREGHADIVDFLLSDRRVDPDSENSEHWTPLTVAAWWGHNDVVHILHNTIARVPPDSTPIEKRCAPTPLEAAIMNGHTAVVNTLLADNRVSPNEACYCKLTPLMLAAERGHEEIVAALIGMGANVDLCYDDRMGRPIAFAAREGHMGVVKLLLDSGSQECDPGAEKSKRPAIVMASEHGREEIVALLVSRGADINAVHMHDDDVDIPCTALKHALLLNKVPTMKLLLDNEVVVHNGILKAAFARRDEEAADLLMKKIKARVKVVSDDPEDLYAAVKHRNVSILERLVEGGRVQMEVPMIEHSNLTALHLAVENRDIEMVQALLNAGAKVDRDWFVRREDWSMRGQHLANLLVESIQEREGIISILY